MSVVIIYEFKLTLFIIFQVGKIYRAEWTLKLLKNGLNLGVSYKKHSRLNNANRWCLHYALNIHLTVILNSSGLLKFVCHLMLFFAFNNLHFFCLNNLFNYLSLSLFFAENAAFDLQYTHILKDNHKLSVVDKQVNQLVSNFRLSLSLFALLFINKYRR